MPWPSTPERVGNDAALDALAQPPRVRVHELAVRPEEGGGPRPSAPVRAGVMLRSTQWAKPPLARASTQFA
eukprot:scaffold60728_cov56-Phaeocystis_antarctica.AAC.1